MLAYADDIVLLAPSLCVQFYLIATILHHNIALSSILINLNVCSFYLEIKVAYASQFLLLMATPVV